MSARFAAALTLITFAAFSLTGAFSLTDAAFSLTGLPSLGARGDFAAALALAAFGVVFIVAVLPSSDTARQCARGGYKRQRRYPDLRTY